MLKIAIIGSDYEQNPIYPAVPKWRLLVFINNDRVLDRLIDGIKLTKDDPSKRGWLHLDLDLTKYQGQAVVIRLYDLVLVPGHEAGNSYWKNIKVE